MTNYEPPARDRRTEAPADILYHLRMLEIVDPAMVAMIKEAQGDARTVTVAPGIMRRMGP